MPARITDRAGGTGRYRYYVLGLLMLTSLLSVADRLVFSILIEDIKATFHFSDTELGLLGGIAFTATYVLAGFPAARLADRSVRKSIIAGAIFVWSGMTALCGIAIGFWTLFFARTGVGVGEGCSGPASQSLLADYFRKEELARAMGFLTIGATTGTVTGLMAGGLMAQYFGWRVAFMAMAVPGVLLSALLYFTVLEPPRGRYAAAGAQVVQQPLGETFLALVRNKVFMGYAAGFAIQIMIGYAMAFWMAPVMLRSFSVSVGDVAFYLGLAYLAGGIPGPIMGGYMTDWLTRHDERWRAWLPGIVSLLAIVPLWLSLVAGEFWWFLGLFALSYGIFVSSQAPILSGIQAAVEPGQRGFSVAIALFFNNLVGQAFGLGVIGWLSDRLAAVHGTASLGMAVLAVALGAAVVAMAIFAWTAHQIKAAAIFAD
ncbi:spinster family MFS transporter [Tsuneonella mangrovi]|uniref:spinster family MFS transporter n=1 Tax=Tsuneonella mangrovi TaxID=1982042 RepID=UPI000BA1C9D2|nr:MFS transporter [Tsuneonella mangrovi]